MAWHALLSRGRSDEALMVSLEGYIPLEQLRADEGRRTVRAESPDGAGPVVIKVLNIGWLSQQTARQAASEAIDRWAQIHHQGFVRPLKVGWCRDGLVLISPFIAAGSLEDRIQARAISSLDLRQLAAELSDALDLAHAHALVHGNLKPPNILFDDDGHVHISDFLFGKAMGGNPAAEGGQDEDHSVYTAPEVRAGGLPTPASDQYSLALVLLTVLSRQSPGHALDWLRARASNPLPGSTGPTREGVSLPVRVASTFRRALLTKPEERYPSVDAFHRAFEYGMGFSTEPEPTVESQPTLPQPQAARPKPRRMAILASALALTACIAISVPVLSSAPVGGSLLDGVLSGAQIEETDVPSPETPHNSTPTVIGDSEMPSGDQNAAIQTSGTNLPPPEPSQDPSDPSPQDTGAQPPTTAPSPPPATAMVVLADSPTPAPTQAPASPTTEPDVNPRSCKADPNHPRYCTPTPGP